MLALKKLDKHAHPCVVIGVLLIGAFGPFFLFLALDEETLPERSRLVEASGRLKSLERRDARRGGMYAVHFTLDGDHRHFSYPDYAGGIYDVWHALERSRREEVRILIDPAATRSTIVDRREFHTPVEISVGEKTIRAYSEVRKSWRSYKGTFIVAGIASILVGAGLLWHHRRHS
jgi:hypothetical protein